jgi:hypothetical protein
MDKEILKNEPTRVLLQWLNIARKCNGYDPFYDGLGDVFTIEEIKTELATREHIPNKKEAKEMRKQRARG